MRLPLPAGAALAILALVTPLGARAQPGPAVRIEAPGPGADPHRPPVVVVDNVVVPNAGAIVTVNARTSGAAHDTKLASMFIVGSMQRGGTQTQSLTAAIEAPAGYLESLARDSHAKLTVVVCRTGGTCTTSAPLPVRIVRPAGS
jgi:hypothetical protein